jgi:hypothetical protein
MKLYDSIAGAGDFLAGSTDEAFARQFDSTPGGGLVEWSNLDRTEFNRDTNGVDTFGDGSNRWIPGLVETVKGEGKNDVSGVLDAAALNFDEGVGGWASLVDSTPGNTAGAGQSPWIEPAREGQPDNPGTTGVPLLDAIWKVLFVVSGLYILVNVVIPLLGIASDVSGALADDG